MNLKLLSSLFQVLIIYIISHNSLSTPQKSQDQSVCGSCWSFGTVGAIEGAYFLNNGNKLVRLSQQALIDCSWGYGNNGCDGGEDFRAYQWMVRINCY